MIADLKIDEKFLDAWEAKLKVPYAQVRIKNSFYTLANISILLNETSVHFPQSTFRETPRTVDAVKRNPEIQLRRTSVGSPTDKNQSKTVDTVPKKPPKRK